MNGRRRVEDVEIGHPADRVASGEGGCLRCWVDGERVVEGQLAVHGEAAWLDEVGCREERVGVDLPPYRVEVGVGQAPAPVIRVSLGERDNVATCDIGGELVACYLGEIYSQAKACVDGVWFVRRVRVRICVGCV